jgi:sucrose-6-phosphate hydrolase SacC (GH32 family)
VAEANLWLRKHAISGNSFEAFIELKPAPGGTVSGLRILKGSSDETVIGFNPATSRVFLDRTRSGDTSFHKSFAGSYEAPVSPRQGRVQLRLFVDACSVEVFCNEGERVLTALVFPSDDARQIECFGPDSAGLIGRLDLWSLTSTPGNS